MAGGWGRGFPLSPPRTVLDGTGCPRMVTDFSVAEGFRPHPTYGEHRAGLVAGVRVAFTLNPAVPTQVPGVPSSEFS